MTVHLAINWRAIQDALYQWACQYTEIPWIWANQDAPQPAYPYGVLNMPSGPTMRAPDEHRFDSIKAEMGVVGFRNFTVSLQVRVGQPAADVSPNDDARSMLTVLQGALRLPSALSLFQASNFCVISDPAITQIDEKVADTWISVCGMDLVCRAASNMTETGVDYFEKLKISSDIHGADDSLNMKDELIEREV